MTNQTSASLRSLRWPNDRDAILALDISFTTERVYRVVVADRSFTLQDKLVSPPLHKTYDLTRDIEAFPALDDVIIAEHDGQVVGVAALIHDTADDRAIVRHLYVDRKHRGQGIGRTLMDAVLTRAKQWQARCLWLETQDVNYSAIHFYQHFGFQWCGLDRSLDEHDGSTTDETAVFFMRSLK
jgi:GNAT superfamily N-acetyltransferase